MSVELIVHAIYARILERSAEPGGLQAWSNGISSGERTIKDTVRAVVHSEEYENRFVRNRSSIEVVQALYAKLLDRGVDPEGQRHWPGVLERQGYRAVADGIIDSEEYTNRWGYGGMPGLGIATVHASILSSIGEAVFEHLFSPPETVRHDVEMRELDQYRREENRERQRVLDFIREQTDDRGWSIT